MIYAATINTPGYLGEDDDVPVFDTPSGAWAYLADERRREEDDANVEDNPDDYSETVDMLDAHATANIGESVVYGDTPGYRGDRDLGQAYCVIQLNSAD